MRRVEVENNGRGSCDSLQEVPEGAGWACQLAVDNIYILKCTGRDGGLRLHLHLLLTGG